MLCAGPVVTSVTVLLDLTMLTVEATRTRGIGRYVADLARAVGARARARSGVEILGIERLDWIGRGRITPDLEGAVARLQACRTRSQAAWATAVRLRLADTARRVRASVVHSPDPEATPLEALGCPRIVTCHDLINLTYPEHYSSWSSGGVAGRRWLDSRRYSRAAHIIAVSETTARELVAKLAIPRERITVVRHGLDLSRLSSAPQPNDPQIRERYGVGSRPYLVYVGGGDWRKNPEGMLKALAILRQRDRGGEPRLVWAGRLSSSERRTVERLAETYRVRDGVHRLGWIPDEELWPLIRGAVALLFVSRAEGFGYPVVEAMALGCPVIAADRSSTVEIAGDAACVVDPERPETIADAVTMLMRDADRRRCLVDRGLIRSRAFDLCRLADETLDVYLRVASSAPAAGA